MVLYIFWGVQQLQQGLNAVFTSPGSRALQTETYGDWDAARSPHPKNSRGRVNSWLGTEHLSCTSSSQLP